MNKFGNSKKDNFLKENELTSSLYNTNDFLTTRCKFNFHYFDNTQQASQDFRDWDHTNLVKLLNNLKLFSESTLKKWEDEKRLVIYTNFPVKEITDFQKPKHIPIEARWGRFRLGSKIRVIGFVIPEDLHNKENEFTQFRWDMNTFYIVFLDKDHKFWKTEKD
ncbi:MAG: hypothetical protein DI602_09795 [Aliarcobacter butzleri]|nr:MAG: hypothetical protein DI602_09795 [Aliarcobacter butzleri]